MVGEALDEFLCTSLPNAKNVVRSEVRNVVKQLVYNMLHKDIVEESLDAHVANVFDIYAAAERLLKKFLTFSSSMAPIGICEEWTGYHQGRDKTQLHPPVKPTGQYRRHV